MNVFISNDQVLVEQITCEGIKCEPIPVNRLGETIQYEGATHSYWVHHLCRILWTDMELMESLAELIKKQCPGIPVDWKSSLDHAQDYMHNHHSPGKNLGCTYTPHNSI